MECIGITFGGDPTARWLEREPEAVDCLEIAATGFFARRSPYLAWLATCVPLLVRASSLSIGTPGPLNAERLSWLAEVGAASNCRFITHPLGFSTSAAIDLGVPVPISLTPASIDVVAEHVMQVSERSGRPALIEPIAAPLRVPGTVGEADFLNRVCRQAGCRLLIDVTTLLVASRNHPFDPRAWLQEIDEDLIAVARIGGVSLHGGRWRRDAQGNPDEAAWALMRDLVSRARPEVLILGAQQHPDGIDGLRRDIDRLRSVGGEKGEKIVSRDSPMPGPANVVTSSEPLVRLDASAASGPEWEGGSERVDIAAGASLFVLDREGVFFCPSRQELSLFNTAATLVWCLLEERLSIPEITATYQKTFGVADAEAARHVGAILQQWFGLGYISAPALPSAPQVPITTALAQVLTNAPLRARFRRSPQATARALGVVGDDARSFAGLDPAEIDAQSEEVERIRLLCRGRGVSADRGERDATGPIDAGWSRAVLAVRRHATRVRYYRLLTTTFSVRVDSEVLDGLVHEALAHLEGPERAPDVALDVRESESGGWIVLDGAVPVRYCHTPDEVVPAVKQLVRETSVNRADWVIKVHAGVVSFGRGCLLLPATAGSGKTTLTAGLIRAGATYFSDEAALLEDGGLAVRPVPLALTIKDGSLAPLRHLYPEIAALTPYLREDHQRVRYLPPPAAALPADDQPQPVRWIVFPRYDPAAETSLRPLDRSTALKKMLSESVVLHDRLDRDKVESLVQGLRAAECFDLPMSSLDAAVGLLRALVAAPT